MLDLRELDRNRLEAAAQHYEEQGYLVLTGAEQAVTSVFRPILAEIIGVATPDLDELFKPDKPLGILPHEVRRKLSRVETSNRLAESLLTSLEPIVRRLLGPIVHVSSSFHAQLKSAPVKNVERGGYQSDYLEVHGPYLLHQDFTGANIPTSPSALTLWVAQNTTSNWNLRLYPGSHRYGMLCNRWIELNDPRLAVLGKPVDIEARRDMAVIFNAMLLHGTSNPGPMQRISCDIRFFPLCGFLPSQPRLVGGWTETTLDEMLAAARGPTLRAPLLETQLYAGIFTPPEPAPPHSVLNWVNFVNCVIQGDPAAALSYLERFTNREIGIDPPEVYASKFLAHPVNQQTLERARRLCPFARSRADLEPMTNNAALLSQAAS